MTKHTALGKDITKEYIKIDILAELMIANGIVNNSQFCYDVGMARRERYEKFQNQENNFEI